MGLMVEYWFNGLRRVSSGHIADRWSAGHLHTGRSSLVTKQLLRAKNKRESIALDAG
jgi:hypothetical protein